VKFHGIYTPAITPLDREGNIDFDAFGAVLESLVAAGVHGIVVGGTTGEYYAHSTEERLATMRRAKAVVGLRLPLVGGTGAIRTEDSIAYAEAAREIGFDAILVSTPPYALPTEHENATHALRVERAAGLPVMLYNYPGRTGAGMGREFLDRVGVRPNICAIKESSGDVARIHLLARDYPHLQMACGMDDQALEFFAWGARSWVCAASNFAPQEHLALWRACVVDGDFTLGRRIMSAMLPLMTELERGGKFVQSIKYGMELAGLPGGLPRAPLRPLNDDDRRSLQSVIATMKTTIAALSAPQSAAAETSTQGRSAKVETLSSHKARGAGR
jgi:4-hydroxy-tetrahydrodipicolinate synthase